jgi:hypothetical protein
MTSKADGGGFRANCISRGRRSVTAQTVGYREDPGFGVNEKIVAKK